MKPPAKKSNLDNQQLTPIYNIYMQPSDYIFGIRAVIEAIEAGKEIDKIFIKKDLSGPLATELIDIARQHHVVM